MRCCGSIAQAVEFASLGGRAFSMAGRRRGIKCDAARTAFPDQCIQRDQHAAQMKSPDCSAELAVVHPETGVFSQRASTPPVELAAFARTMSMLSNATKIPSL